MLIARGYGALDEITDDNMAQIPSGTRGQDVLDVALCRLGILERTPQRGTSRRSRRPRRTIAELVAMSDVPAPFRAITSLYLDTYATRISQVYVTLRHKLIALGHFWRFLAEQYPDITRSADVLPAHGRAYIPYAIARARERQRGDDTGPELRNTAHVWLLEVRTFFADLCTWATEPDSAFGPHAPRVVPLMRRDLVGIGFEKARARTQARITATILDLEREMPTIRACALQQWKAATVALPLTPGDRRAVAAEAATFWDWALVELFVQSGLRIEEASELTTLDILKRQLPDGRVYYLLHIKPSKFDRARVIPIGDGLGRVIAEIIRHVKRFYGVEAVPSCDHWDHHERQPRPRAPYLLQGQPYTGINILSLWASASVQGFASPIWMTYRQAVELRAHVRKGEKGSPVVYANSITRTETDTDNGVDVARDIHFLKGYTVFNVEQIEGLPAQYTAPASPRLDVSARIARAERFFGATGATLAHGGNRAFYRPSTDSIVLPLFETFLDPESYYAAHETTHWTAHESRLARDFGTKRFGSEGYAIEELVAELGAAFLCADLDLALEPREDHAAYIAIWLDVLTADNRAIFAAAHAQRAADFINGLQPASAG